MGRLEALVDASGVAPLLEAALPKGVRHRQLPARSLLLGLLASQAEGRPAHLSRAHEALLSLPPAEQERLKVTENWPAGPHALTYRQVWHTAHLVFTALAKASPDGQPSALAQEASDALLEASVPGGAKELSSSLAVDWTDLESFARPPVPEVRPSVDKEASWGRRRAHGPGQKNEVFYGYYLSTAAIARDEDGPEAPEVVRRATLSSCAVDPVPALVPVLEGLAGSGAKLGDVIADSAYAHRAAQNWALPLRRAGAALVQDLHPNDRGPRGTHQGAICGNGNLYCPAVPKALLGLVPLARDASPGEVKDHDQRSAELARYKLSRTCADDQDGYHRVSCPAVMGKLRCPLRATSMALPHDRPTVSSPPQHPPACCAQRTITVPASINAKTAQKHDWPGPAWRKSYARRTAAERAYSTIKDRASNDISRGWCRLMGLAPIFFFVTCCLVARNLRVLDAFEARQAEDRRRAAAGLPPRSRKKRRRALGDMLSSAPAVPP